VTLSRLYKKENSIYKCFHSVDEDPEASRCANWNAGDGTLTTADTTETLAGLGYRHNWQHSTDVTKWGDIVAAYVEDMERHAVTYEPHAKQRRSIEEECAFLSSLDEIEQRIVRRVEAADVFRD